MAQTKDNKVIIAYVVFFLMATGVIVYALRKSRTSPFHAHENNQLLGTGDLPDMDLPRGIRNNNPGNIRVANNNWLGKIPIEQNTDSTYVNGQLQVVKDFEQFNEFKYGLRAMIKLLQNYQYNHGLMTIREIINRWAPPSENPSNIYAMNVANAMGVGLDENIGMNRETMRPMIKQMVKSENGVGNWVSDADFDAAYDLV